MFLVIHFINPGPIYKMYHICMYSCSNYHLIFEEEEKHDVAGKVNDAKRTGEESNEKDKMNSAREKEADHVIGKGSKSFDEEEKIMSKVTTEPGGQSGG